MKILKSIIFVVLVLIWSKMAAVRLKMHQEATPPPPHMVSWGWGQGMMFFPTR
jgi:hypothetical protein